MGRATPQVVCCGGDGSGHEALKLDWTSPPLAHSPALSHGQREMTLLSLEGGSLLPDNQSAARSKGRGVQRVAPDVPGSSRAEGKATHIAITTAWAASPPASCGRAVRYKPFRATARVVLGHPQVSSANTLLSRLRFHQIELSGLCLSALCLALARLCGEASG